jgi:large subunit ribosomal protein L3
MPLGLLGLKVGMTQIYDDQGKIAPVTVLQLGPCPVLQVRTVERDGYNGLQLGFLDKARHRATQAERGHVSEKMESKRRQAGVQLLLPKAECEPQRFLREFRLEEPAQVQAGAVLKATEVFKDTRAVDVISKSKGRGFTGSMKRHNFQGLPAAHGAKKVHRSGGSIGSHASNRGSGRPKKGHKAAGQYGATRVTIRNLKVVRLEENLLLVRGAVPGPNGGLVLVRPTNKKK